jgi:membrane dipeptidase
VYEPYEFGLDAAGEERAARLHSAALIIDGLGGSMLMRPAPDVEGDDRIDQYRVNGVTVSNETIAMPGEGARETIKRVFDYMCLDAVAGGRASRVKTADDILSHHANGTLGLLYGLQAADPFEGDTYMIAIFHELGVRIANLVYNERNRLGDGCMEPGNQGLTAFGKSVVLEMNRVGMTVDLSHTGERTSLDAAKVSRAPVVFSHSCARRLTDHPRNLTDDQIRAAADTGGLVGLCPHSQFCEKERGVRPTVDDFLDHIAYVADLIGVEHVGIGTDLFGGKTLGETVFRFQFGRQVPGAWGGYTIDEKYVAGFDTVYGWRNVTRGLVARGFSDDEVLAILGGNWLRVLGRTWTAA